jgi:hypothetical protein
LGEADVEEGEEEHQIETADPSDEGADGDADGVYVMAMARVAASSTIKLHLPVGWKVKWLYSNHENRRTG